MNLTPAQHALLTEMRDCRRFTVVRMELYSTKEPELVSTALDCLHLDQPETSLAQAKPLCALLREMADAGMVNLCYTPRVTARSDYAVYEQSAIFAELHALAQEGASRPGFLFDAARIRRGVATVTAKGRALYRAE